MLETEEMKSNVTNEQSGEDMLLAQIDAFRDKAKQLQSLISAKENRVRQLEEMVREKESLNAELQEELARKQVEADGIVADVETQVDRMMKTLRTNMDHLEKRMEDQIASNQEHAAEQTKHVKETLEEMTTGLDAIKTDLSEKVHSESVLQYRNIQDLMNEMDHSEEESAANEKKFAGLRKRTTFITVVTIFNTLVSFVTLALVFLMYGIL